MRPPQFQDYILLKLSSESVLQVVPLEWPTKMLLANLLVVHLFDDIMLGLFEGAVKATEARRKQPHR